jgi:hypothetical protein
VWWAHAFRRAQCCQALSLHTLVRASVCVCVRVCVCVCVRACMRVLSLIACMRSRRSIVEAWNVCTLDVLYQVLSQLGYHK